MGESDHVLKVVKGFEEGKTIPLAGDEMTLGRSDENDIVIRVAEVSRRHAILNRQEDRYLLRDLGSTNGTFVDRKRIGGKYLLKPGDTIMLGDAVHLVYETEFDEVDPLQDTPPSPMAVPEPPPPPPQPPVDAGEDAAPEKQAPRPAARAEAVPDGPVEEEEEQEEGGNTWLWAGIGCLVVVLFFAVVGLIFFDYFNLWCTPPFDSLLSIFYTCPP